MESYLGCLGIPPIHNDCTVSLFLEVFEDAVHFWFQVFQFGIDRVLRKSVRLSVFKNDYKT